MLIRSSLILAFTAIISIFSVFALPPFQILESSQAADCLSKACIKVFTQGGQIVIEGNKGSGAKKITTSPRAIAPPPPRIAKPKSIATRPPALLHRFVKPAPHTVKSTPSRILKPGLKRKNTPGVSLNDRLVKLLPMAKIGRAPRIGAIINVPVIFWCDLPTQFTAKISIVGEVVDLAMRPAFFWSFGDGSILLTTLPGSDYPRAEISHIYHRPGHYLLTLIATWGGVWSMDGVSRSITGKVRQITLAHLEVLSAPTIITS